MVRTLRGRTERKVEDISGEDQFRFRRGKGTVDAVGMLRIISEGTLETGEEFCVCFIDWQKDQINADPEGNWYRLA